MCTPPACQRASTTGCVRASFQLLHRAGAAGLLLQQPSGLCGHEAMHLASTVQVLNLLMYKLTRQPYDEEQLAFLAVDEHLVDIGDDLCELCLQTRCTDTPACRCAMACCVLPASRQEAIVTRSFIGTQMTTKMTSSKTPSTSSEVCSVKVDRCC